jgi:septal ring factor EnvC (AmiA/AmiB activator)
MKLVAAAALMTALAGASATGQVPAQPLESDLQRAQLEQRAAEAQEAKLAQAAQSARSDADRFRSEQLAAAQAIEAAEARITTAETGLRLASAYVAAHRQRLAVEQQPVSALLAGLALMADRPPLLALADRNGSDSLVRVRILLGATLPAIRSRTAALSQQLAEGQRLQQAAVAARAELARSRDQLAERQKRFAALGDQAYARALASSGEALSAGDVGLAAGEDVERLRAAETSTQSIRALAAQLAAGDTPPLSPFAPDRPAERPPFAYQLPAVAAVSEGLDAVNDSGVRSRGITLQTGRGTAVAAPADGIVRYSGPFRDYDGVVIIDHGGGWLSLIVNVSSTLQPGDRVRFGAPIGRATGSIEVDLSHKGQRISPALIAGSSATLSKAGKGG